MEMVLSIFKSFFNKLSVVTHVTVLEVKVPDDSSLYLKV